MDVAARTNLENIHSTDSEAQFKAFDSLLSATDQPVDWAYEAWAGLVKDLTHKDNHVRAIASQLLCNLAKSDPENRMLKDFAALLAVTKDERFVTARHCLQSLWKIGLVAPQQRQMLLLGLEGRYKECIAEKNGTLIRYDILQVLRTVYDAVKDPAVKDKALELIPLEEDPKYRKKYTGVWRNS